MLIIKIWNALDDEKRYVTASTMYINVFRKLASHAKTQGFKIKMLLKPEQNQPFRIYITVFEKNEVRRGIAAWKGNE